MTISNFILRFISSAILLSLLICVLYLGEYALYASLIFLSMLEYKELQSMFEQKSKILYCISVCIIILLNTSLLFIYSKDHLIFLWLIIGVITNDIFAYCFGKYIKGYKLLPKISPGKTWSGFLGGSIFSCASCMGFGLAMGLDLRFMLLCIFIGPLATIGDLLESTAKRYCNIKDSGQIIPGHGGILDRIDGFIIIAPVVAYFLL